MNRITKSLLIVSALTLITVPALAQNVKNEAKDNPIFLNFLTTHGNAYIAGSEVSLTDKVTGDLVTAGGNITINGAVDQDILAAGGNIFINAPAGGDVRIAGGTLVTSGNVNGDLVAAGGTISVSSNSIVRGDLLIGGGQVTIAGTVNGASTIRSGTANISGELKGKTDISADQIVISGTFDGDTALAGKSITLTSTAVLKGKIRYWLPEAEKAAFEASPQLKGSVTFDPTLEKSGKSGPSKNEMAGAFLALFLGFELYMLCAMAIIILLLVLASKTFVPDAARELSVNPWKCLLLGFLYFAAVPVASFLLILTVIGIPLAATIFVVYMISLFFAKAVAAVVIAEMVNLRRKVRWGTFMMLLMSIVAYILLKIVGAVPLIGWIISIAVMFLSYGAMLTIKWERWKKVR
ncbi:MAG: polymer-forming cytoskeletal protein [Candidatus Peregrinibacteria bacterium]